MVTLFDGDTVRVLYGR